MVFHNRIHILFSILLIVAIFAQISFYNRFLCNRQSKFGQEVAMNIQPQATELRAIKSNAYHSLGKFSTVQEKSRSDTVVLGILSTANHFCLREAQRKTFISKAKAYTLLNIQVFFVLDEKTAELEAEQEINQDIVFLNTTVHGWGRKFALKLHMWLRYVITNIPNVVLIGRMDDDAFVCAPQMFQRLNEVKNKLLYYGYPTGTLHQCPTQECVDDMYLIVGVELAQRVANRHFCQEQKEEHCLIEGDSNAGHMFRKWIRIYNDFVFVNERANGKMVWFYRSTKNQNEFRKYRTFNFCSRFLLFHKATVADIYDMHLNNSLLLKDGFDTDITKEKTNTANKCLK